MKGKEEVVPLTLATKLKLVALFTFIIALLITITTVSILTTKEDNQDDGTPEGIVESALKNMKIIDGRNNFASNLRNLLFNDLSKFNFSANLSEVSPWASFPGSQTDLQKLKDGKVGGQFWVASADCHSQHKDAVMQTLEQIDVIKRLIQQNEDDMHFSTSAKDIENTVKDDKVASLIAIGGGHLVQSSLGVLRMYYDLGVRLITVAPDNCSTPWIDSSAVADVESSSPTPPVISFGLTAFGGNMIYEMNRLGMIIDLSYGSRESIMSVLRQSEAPVVFSHSAAFSLCEHHSNLNDDILQLVHEKNGLIMVDVDLHSMQCSGEVATLEDVAYHIEYIRNLTDVDSVGIGGNYDGTDRPATGLENPSKYPDLFLYLARTERWSREDLEKLAGRNLLRVFKAVEEVRDKYSSSQPPIQATITRQDLQRHGVDTYTCISSNFTDDFR